MKVLRVNTNLDKEHFSIKDGEITTSGNLIKFHESYRILEGDNSEKGFVKLIPGNNWSSAVNVNLPVYGDDGLVKRRRRALVLCNTRGEVYMVISGVKELIQIYAFDALAKKVTVEGDYTKIINRMGREYMVGLSISSRGKLVAQVYDIVKAENIRERIVRRKQIIRNAISESENVRHFNIDDPVIYSANRLNVVYSDVEKTTIVTIDRQGIEHDSVCSTRELSSALTKFRRAIRSGWTFDTKVYYDCGGYLRLVTSGRRNIKMLQRAKRNCEDEFTILPQMYNDVIGEMIGKLAATETAVQAT